ncbi:hypothetical protein Psi02_09670 [Planotetraspora silvatica]|uniref:Fibronectin type-III domain-containing protein n=1 Tax=Planotetraspora silvatica TaxID=234614 RepID=A0A8J3UFW3_9ACTN|nr:Ig-like domain repeat protein [Planotetraspora silvatica]GII44543.1 hypothetical protein Psi02_09670 [Planotetraspora silvatica]
MRSKRTMTAAAATLAAAVAVSGLTLTGPAYADPATGTFAALVGVGSDTTQDVMNALAKSLSPTGTGIASYDAIAPGTTGSTTSVIQTRKGGPFFTRPNGSGKGRAALSASLTGLTTFPDGNGVKIPGQVDFARSSGAPSVTGGTLTYIPYARDAVGLAVKGAALKQLTAQQLHEIYSGALTVVNGLTVHPYLPQAGSGTRSFFLNAIGLTETTIKSGIDTVQENQANDLLTGDVIADGALVPFSVASWIAQNNGVSPDHSKKAVAAGAYLASIKTSDAATTYLAPVSTVSGKVAGNTSYYNDATFGRDVFNVVPTRAIDTTSIFYKQSLYDIFVTNGTHKAALASTANQKIIADYGFLNEPYNGSINASNHAKLGGLEDGSTNAVPGAPTLTTVTGAGSAKLTWAAPKVNPGLPVTDYRVVLTGPTGAVVANKDFSATTRSYTFTGLAAGKYSARVYADNLGGVSAPVSWTGTVPAVPKVASKVTATAPTSYYGQAGHVSVTVTGANSIVPTGKVTLKEGTSTLGSATLVKGKATVALSKTLKVGAHTFTVSYAGDSKLNSSSATVKKTVSKALATVTAKAPSRTKTNVHVKVTVTVTATGTVPSGTVRIYEGKKIIATGTLKSGKVVVSLPFLKKGKHVLHAYYLGSSNVNVKTGGNFTITGF